MVRARSFIVLGLTNGLVPFLIFPLISIRFCFLLKVELLISQRFAIKDFRLNFKTVPLIFISADLCSLV